MPKSNIRVLDNVDASISGDDLLTLEEFEKFVGVSAIRTWDRCRLARDKDGYVVASNQELATIRGWGSVSRHTIYKGMQRMYSLKLAERIGHKKYIVYGSPALVDNTPYIILPRLVSEQIKNSTYWGGARKPCKNRVKKINVSNGIYLDSRANKTEKLNQDGKNTNYFVSRKIQNLENMEARGNKTRARGNKNELKNNKQNKVSSCCVEKKEYQPFRMFRALHLISKLNQPLDTRSVLLLRSINLSTLTKKEKLKDPGNSNLFIINKNKLGFRPAKQGGIFFCLSKNRKDKNKIYSSTDLKSGGLVFPSNVFPRASKGSNQMKDIQRVRLPSGATRIIIPEGSHREPDLDNEVFKEPVQKISDFIESFDQPGRRRPSVYLRKRFLRVPGVPPAPSALEIKTPMVKGPPDLKASQSHFERFRTIARTYAAAFNNKYGLYGKHCYTFTKALKSPEKAERSKYYKTIQCVAEILIEKGIPPASWIMFSFDMWHEYHGEHDEDDPPPIKWVLATKRIEEKYGWFWGESARYMGGRKLYTDTHYEIMRRHSEMYNQMKRLPVDIDDTEVLKVKEEYFPGDLYAELVKKANQKTEEVQKMLDDLRSKGKWMWDSSWGIPEWLNKELDYSIGKNNQQQLKIY